MDKRLRIPTLDLHLTVRTKITHASNILKFAQKDESHLSRQRMKEFAPHYAYIIAAIGGVLGIAGGILAFVDNYPLHYGIIGVVLGVICLLLEFPMFRVGLLKHPILRGIWYFISGIVFLVIGIFTVNPVMGLFVAAGCIHLFASLLYVLSRCCGRPVKHNHHHIGGHSRV